MHSTGLTGRLHQCIPKTAPQYRLHYLHLYFRAAPALGLMGKGLKSHEHMVVSPLGTRIAFIGGWARSCSVALMCMCLCRTSQHTLYMNRPEPLHRSCHALRHFLSCRVSVNSECASSHHLPPTLISHHNIQNNRSRRIRTCRVWAAEDMAAGREDELSLQRSELP
jgi:hypothetical protein